MNRPVTQDLSYPIYRRRNHVDVQSPEEMIVRRIKVVLVVGMPVLDESS